MFNYPETDDSMTAWTQMLAMSAEDYVGAMQRHEHDAAASAKALFHEELQRCIEFYSIERYGPFKACRGKMEHGSFICESTRDLPMTLHSQFAAPQRRSSVWVMTEKNFQLYFNMASPKEYESVGNIMLICFIILTMICFGMLMSANVSEIALTPLERMLSAVRERC